MVLASWSRTEIGRASVRRFTSRASEQRAGSTTDRITRAEKAATIEHPCSMKSRRVRRLAKSANRTGNLEGRFGTFSSPEMRLGCGLA
jgi:hypothetical protein